MGDMTRWVIGSRLVAGEAMHAPEASGLGCHAGDRGVRSTRPSARELR